MEEIEINRLAGAMNQLRPEWPVASLRTFLRTHFAERAFRDMALAAAYVAADERTKTPELLRQTGPWWNVGPASTDRGTPRVGPEPGEDRCRFAGHEHESAARCRACAAEEAAGDQPEPTSAPVPAPPAIVALANRRRTRVEAGGLPESRSFANDQPLAQPAPFDVSRCARTGCGGYFVRDPAGYGAHKSVFGHEPVVAAPEVDLEAASGANGRTMAQIVAETEEPA